MDSPDDILPETSKSVGRTVLYPSKEKKNSRRNAKDVIVRFFSFCWFPLLDPERASSPWYYYICWGKKKLCGTFILSVCCAFDGAEKEKNRIFCFCFVQGHLTINNKKNKRKGVLFVRGFSFWRLSLEGMLIKLHATRHFSGSCPDVPPFPNKFVSPCNNTKHFKKKYFYIS